MTQQTISKRLKIILPHLDSTTLARIEGLIDKAVEDGYNLGRKMAEEIGVRHSTEKKDTLHQCAFTRHYRGKNVNH